MFIDHTSKQFQQWPDAVLNGALLVAAAFLIVLALTPGHRILKTIVLAYIVLPLGGNYA
jgi:hypothetical protein